MGINLRSTHIGMPKQGLHRANVTAAAQPFGGNCESKSVAASQCTNRRRSHSSSCRLLYRTYVQVAPHDVALIVYTQTLRGKQPLPRERRRRVRVFAAQRIGQAGVVLVKRILLARGTLDTCFVIPQRLNQRARPSLRALDPLGRESLACTNVFLLE